MTAFLRLLKYPHGAVFDKSPLSEPVVRVRRDGGLSWSVADEILTLAAGEDSWTYALADHTVGTLTAAMTADGHDVSPLSPDFASLSATVLVEGSGDQGRSNGDLMSGFKNPLWSLFAGYAKEVREAEYQVQQALRQMIIYQAEGEWLDLWGFLYNTPRIPAEQDADYAERIPEEAFRIRVNALGIEKAVLDATGKDIRIEEPWRWMFRLDESPLSGDHRFYDGSSIGPHLIRPVSRVSIDWADVLAVIHRNRAAGIMVLDPETRLGAHVDASIDGTVWVGVSSLHASFTQFWPDNRLCYLVLSAEEITRNWPVMMSSLVSTTNNDPLLDPVSIAFRRTIAMASVVLSDGPPLGDENAVFPRAELTQLGGEMGMSDDLALSDTDRPVWRPVDVITLETNARGELDTAGPVDASIAPWEIRSSLAVADISGNTLVAGSQSLFVAANEQSPVAVWAAMYDISGYTWLTAGSWGEIAWNTSVADFEALEAAAENINDYANNGLSEDLQ